MNIAPIIFMTAWLLGRNVIFNMWSFSNEQERICH
jgi:hypothetical protein